MLLLGEISKSIYIQELYISTYYAFRIVYMEHRLHLYLKSFTIHYQVNEARAKGDRKIKYRVPHYLYIRVWDAIAFMNTRFSHLNLTSF